MFHNRDRFEFQVPKESKNVFSKGNSDFRILGHEILVILLVMNI